MELMLLEPVGKDYLWGGSRLQEEYHKCMDVVPLAETWECSVHPDGPSIVMNGKFAGKTLSSVLEEHPEFLGTKQSGNMPILVKLIDAEKDLSVQVHPDDEYARKIEEENGKTEMWYVIDAKPGASLIYGFAHKVTKEQLQNAIETGQLMKHLQKVPVHKDDVFYIPAGTVHAIGAGILLAEVQESSNITYRVYDYDRVGKDGKKRELHFEKAIQVMDMEPAIEARQKPKIVHYNPRCSRELLCRCQYFEVERIQTTEFFVFEVLEKSFQVILCLKGRGVIKTRKLNNMISFVKGNCMFVPAGMGECVVEGNVTLLKIRC